MSWQRTTAMMLGGAAAGLAAYDVIRGYTYPTLSAETIKGEGKDQVGSTSWVKKVLSAKPLRKPPIVITSIDQIDPMITDCKLESYRYAVKEMVKIVTEEGRNALAVQGEKHDYLVLPVKADKAVIEHEIGHLRAREEGKDKPSGFIDRLAALFWKPSYRKTTLDPEEAAWGYVRGREEIKRKALGSYERGFHHDRAALVGPVGAALLLGGALSAH